MWGVLEVTHDGTEEIRRIRRKIFSYKIEIFRMLRGEIIYDVQKRFNHIMNHLIVLEKVYRKEIDIKILKSSSRTW